MLGAAQTAALAGWWGTGAAPVKVDMNLTFSVDILQPTLASPRYVADFNDASSNNVGMFSYSNSSGSGQNMDMASIVQQPRKTIHAFTIKPGQDWLASPPGGFVDGIRRFVGFNNNGTQNFFVIGAFHDNDGYLFGLNGLNPVVIPDSEFDANRRDHWFGITLATSNTSASFSDWNGGSDNGTGIATRTSVFDITANELMGVNDSWFYNTGEANNIGNIDLSQQWTADFESSSYYTNDFISWNGNIQQYNRKDLDIGSHWFAIGETIDPKTYYKDFIGFTLTPTIQGIKAWQYWLYDEPGTALTNTVTWGYYQPMGPNSRYPSTGQVQIETEFDTPNPPKFTKIS